MCARLYSEVFSESWPAASSAPDLVPWSFPGQASAGFRAQPCPSSNAQPRCMPIRHHSAIEAILAEGWQHEGMEPLTVEWDGIWMTCRSCRLYYGDRKELWYNWGAESHIQGRRHGKSRRYYFGSDDYYRHISLLVQESAAGSAAGAQPEPQTRVQLSLEDAQPEAVLPQVRPEDAQPEAVLPQVRPEDEQPEAVLPQVRTEDEQPEAVLPQVQPEDEQPEAVLPQVQPETTRSKANKIPAGWVFATSD